MHQKILLGDIPKVQENLQGMSFQEMDQELSLKRKIVIQRTIKFWEILLAWIMMVKMQY